ncbi:MAG: GatB/YqeY domain-containing protein [Bryobacterales bacterium]|nr:GatB/YqeY domain-containing protein [Bryobacterales bacterium]
MALLERVQKDMVEAMKAKDEVRLNAIRMLKAALMKHKVDTMKELDEVEELKVLNIIIKQRKESAEVFRKNGREAQAAAEEAELKLMEGYMPASASDEEIEAAIAAAMAETGITSSKQMGVVMKATQAKLTGKRVDGKALSDKVRSKLQA